MQAQIEISDLRVSANGISATIRQNDLIPSLPHEAGLQINYPVSVPFDKHDIRQIVIASVLPIAASANIPFSIRLPFDPSDREKKYWADYLSHFPSLNGVSFSLEKNPGQKIKRSLSAILHHFPIIRKSRNERIAILFGGGVESLFGVSQLIHHRPILIAITGEQFMNSDYNRNSIKQDIQSKFEKKTGLSILNIETNIRKISQVDDLTMNEYATGAWMYFYALPLLRKFDAGYLLKVSEYEEASIFWDYDKSINARFLQYIPDGPSQPSFLPMFNAYSKIQMFDVLSRTSFFEYIYSCLHNTERRWCGECSKCRRIAEYCRRLNIDPARIGMPLDIEYTTPQKGLELLYNEMMNRLYPYQPSVPLVPLPAVLPGK